jgi:hypothetical protein
MRWNEKAAGACTSDVTRRLLCPPHGRARRAIHLSRSNRGLDCRSHHGFGVLNLRSKVSERHLQAREGAIDPLTANWRALSANKITPTTAMLREF